MHQRRGEETASQVFQSKRSYSSWEKIALAFLSLSPFQENRCVRFAWSYPPAPCWEKQMKTALLYILLLYPCTSGILNFFLTWHSSLFHFFSLLFTKDLLAPHPNTRGEKEDKGRRSAVLEDGSYIGFLLLPNSKKRKDTWQETTAQCWETSPYNSNQSPKSWRRYIQKGTPFAISCCRIDNYFYFQGSTRIQ